MWLVLGVITLIGSLLVGWKLRREAAWKGNTDTHGEFAFTRTSKKGRQPNDWRFGIPVKDLPEFRLKPQSLFDATFQKLRISNEVQTGDAAFDRTVYVVSDLPVVRTALQRDPELRRRLVALFQSFQQCGYRVREVRLARDRLWVRASSRQDFDRSMLKQVRQWLEQVAERLPPAHGGQRFDPYFFKAAAVLTLSTGLAISGVLMLFGLSGAYPPFVAGSGGLWAASISATVPLLAALVFASLMLLGRSARTHLILVELLLVGGLGVWSWTFVGLHEANWRLDTSAPRPVELTMVSKAHWTTKSTTRSGKGRRRRTTTTHHYELRFDRPLSLADGDSPTGAPHRLRVNQSEYLSASEGSAWQFVLRRGRLGWPWIESHRQLPLD